MQGHAAADPLLAGHGGEGERRGGDVCGAVLQLLAGRGGEGKGWNLASPFSSVFKSGCCPWRLAALVTARPGHRGGGRSCRCWFAARRPIREAANQRRRVGAVVIFGQRGHVLLVHLELFFREAKTTHLCAQMPVWELIGDLTTGSKHGDAPSGMFPGGGAVSRAARSSRRGGEDRGLDCFFHFLPRVFDVKVAALSVNPLLARGLVVKCIPSPN